MAGIYLHIPFCLSKCSYCDFYSVIYSEELVSGFLPALKTEIQLQSDFFLNNKKIDTIYLGGGTPSLLSGEEIKDIFKQIYRSFRVKDSAEITLEVNPGSITGKDISVYKQTGINRISIGAQSFNKNELDLMQRIHTIDDIKILWSLVQQAGMENFNLDLIFGLPGQKLSDWEYTLSESLILQPKHISAYALTWSSKTPLGRKISKGNIPTPQEETVREMFLFADNILTENGYEHYEISNYALPGYRCVHNEAYWSGQPYLGLGPSAHSFTGEKRFWNVSGVQEYISHLSRSMLPIEGEEILSPEQKRTENIAVGLRRKEGIDMGKNNINLSLIEDFMQKGFALQEENVLKLTSQGMLFADEVALRLV
ncbi:MAG: radical SAM family heme chaperone HemW [bacterium]